MCISFNDLVFQNSALFQPLWAHSVIQASKLLGLQLYHSMRVNHQTYFTLFFLAIVIDCFAHVFSSHICNSVPLGLNDILIAVIIVCVKNFFHFFFLLICEN